MAVLMQTMRKPQYRWQTSMICISKRWVKLIQESNRLSFFCARPRHTVDINLSSSFQRFNSSLFSLSLFCRFRFCVSNFEHTVECSWKCKGSIRDLWWLSRALHSIRLCRLVLIDRTICRILGAAEQFHRNSIRRVQGLFSAHIYSLIASQQRDTGNWTIIVSVNIPSCHIIYVISVIFISYAQLCKTFRRPLAKRAKNIGAWQRAFEVLACLSIITNCGVMYLNSDLRWALSACS